MSSYCDFAYIYDSLMADADYDGRSEYILKLFRKYGKKPTLLLDLACGTGEFSLRLKEKGIDVIGVDMSEDMLSIAREKAMDKNTDLLFLCQKAEELDLYGTVDGAICCMDSLNHITDLRNLKKAIKKVSLFLEKGCLFVFDLNTPYKHKTVLGNNTFVFEEDDVYCVWQNSFNPKNNITDICLDFFVEEDGLYQRYNEEFRERAYTKEQISETLKEAGLKIKAILGDLKFTAPSSKEERVFYVCEKI